MYHNIIRPMYYTAGNLKKMPSMPDEKDKNDAHKFTFVMMTFVMSSFHIL